MTRKIAIPSLLPMTAALLFPAAALADSGGKSSVAGILERFAEDYASDPSLKAEAEFGVRVEGAMWSITAAPGNVTVREGDPSKPTFFFVTDEATLGKIDRGELNSLTAMGKAKSSDFAPLDIEVMDGFAPDDEFVADALSIAFHFWTRGFPERVPYSHERTRVVHGANVVVFYYQPVFRSAWFEIEKGQHANKDPKEQSNPFPSLLITMNGKAKARIGGKEVDLKEREAVFIPAGTTHEFWNPYNKPAEGVLLMFGDGA